MPTGAAGEKFLKFDHFYAFLRPKFEFLSQNLDILPKICNFKRPKSILSSANFCRFFAVFWPKNSKRQNGKNGKKTGKNGKRQTRPPLSCTQNLAFFRVAGFFRVFRGFFSFGIALQHVSKSRSRIPHFSKIRCLYIILSMEFYFIFLSWQQLSPYLLLFLHVS